MFRQTLATSLVLAASHAVSTRLMTSTLSELGDHELNVDYCVAPDTYSYTEFPIGSGRNVNLHFNSDTYLAKSRTAKMTDLWRQIEENDSIVCQTFGGLQDLFKQRPVQSFDVLGDQMPLRSFVDGVASERPRVTRKKLVHQQGLVAKAKFTTNGAGQVYTGIFASGSDSAIIRLSDADLHVPGVSPGWNPSFAIKFLRDGMAAANQFGMLQFEHIEGNWDFFGHDFQSHLPEHEGDCGPQTFAKFNASAFTTIFQTGSNDMASFNEDGAEPTRTKDFPFYLRYVPVRTGNVPPVTDGDSPWFEQLQGSAIPAGTHLFDVYAMDSRPTCTGRGCTIPTPQSIPTSDLTLIGTIDTETEFVQSLWADEHLYFAHGKFNDDTDADLGGDSGNRRQLLRFDEDFWGVYPAEDFSPPDVTDQGVLDGMTGTGCPFQWIIDALE